MKKKTTASRKKEKVQEDIPDVVLPIESGKKKRAVLPLIACTVLGLFVSIITVLVIVALLFVGSYVHTITTNSGVSIQKLVSTLYQGWKTPVPQTQGRTNLLILGTDS